MSDKTFSTKNGESISPEQITTLIPYANITEDYKARLNDGRYVYFSKSVGYSLEIYLKKM